MIPFLIYIGILLELLCVSYLDYKYKKIKNSWSFVNLFFTMFFLIFLPEYYPFVVETFQFTFVFIFVGFVLFLLKIMGGGDSKFLATFFLLIPLKLQDNTFYYLLIFTVMVGFIVFIKNLINQRDVLFQAFKDQNIQGVKTCFGTKFAYAPVILLAWLYIGWDVFTK